MTPGLWIVRVRLVLGCDLNTGEYCICSTSRSVPARTEARGWTVRGVRPRLLDRHQQPRRGVQCVRHRGVDRHRHEHTGQPVRYVNRTTLHLCTRTHTHARTHTHTRGKCLRAWIVQSAGAGHVIVCVCVCVLCVCVRVQANQGYNALVLYVSQHSCYHVS